MAEEFHESEVVFQESRGFEEINDDVDYEYRDPARNRKLRRTPATAAAAAVSLPVNIPDNFSRTTSSWLRGCIVNKEGESFDDGEMVPPHVITGRRIAGKMMAFSVCTGNGRTLKGRDLSQVRNSILRMTGFLET